MEKKERKIIKDEYDSQLKDYRNNDQEERTKYINNKLSKLPLHEQLRKLNFDDIMTDFEATSLYPSAMWDESSVYSKIETGFAFKPHMNDVFVKAFNDQTFNHDGSKSAVSKRKYYNPPILLFQHLPVKEKG